MHNNNVKIIVQTYSFFKTPIYLPIFVSGFYITFLILHIMIFLSTFTFNGSHRSTGSTIRKMSCLIGKVLALFDHYSMSLSALVVAIFIIILYTFWPAITRMLICQKFNFQTCYKKVKFQKCHKFKFLTFKNFIVGRNYCVPPISCVLNVFSSILCLNGDLLPFGFLTVILAVGYIVCFSL